MIEIGGLNILILAAVKAEIGKACERSGINPFFIGVGPIEATLNVTRYLEKLSRENTLPDVIFSVGSAGSAKLAQGALFQINAVSYRDMDASAFGFSVGETPFSDFPARVGLPVATPDFPAASLSSGGAIITKNGSAGKNFNDLTEDMADMETYAVARTVTAFNIPLFGLRGVSDGAEDPEGIATWEKYLSVIDEKIAEYFRNLRARENEFSDCVKTLRSTALFLAA